MSAHAFSPDGKVLSGREGESNIVFFDTSTWEKIKIITDTSARIQSAEFTPDGEVLIACARNGDIIFWNWKTETKLRTLSVSSFLPTVLSPDGKILVSYNEFDGEIYLWGVP
ncbi:MAG: hypothetical protein JXB38_01190 [Anaerolineales bacterium]|nr:hypothetical protein [Anaerolineales bacterium]